MVRIMARISAREGYEAKLEAILQELRGPSRGETGCLTYEVFHNLDYPQEFVTVEEWCDQAAADAHLQTPHVAAAISAAAELLAHPPLIHRFRALT